MSRAPQMVRQSEQSEKREDSQETGGNSAVRTAIPDIGSYFPGTEYRSGQREAIEQIFDAFVRRNRRFVVAELPTGVGKSHIAITFAKFYRTAHILTIQKILQSQYVSTFSDLFDMRGRSSYLCYQRLADVEKLYSSSLRPFVSKEQYIETNFLSLSCAKGPCRLGKKCSESYCQYREALLQANRSDVVVHNFDSFYYQNSIAHAFRPRELLVIDECHQIESKYVDFLSFTLSNRSDPQLQLKEMDKAEDYVPIVENEWKRLGNVVDALDEKMRCEGLTPVELARYEEYSELGRKMERFVTRLRSPSKAEYVADFIDHKDHQTVLFRPISIGDEVITKLFSYGQRVLMLSATIVDKSFFCDSVGLDEDDVEFITMPSPFPIKNRPIVKAYTGDMSYTCIDASLPKMLAGVRKILAKYPGKRGIIQTHTERIANYIKLNCEDPRLTFRKDYPSVEAMLAAHEAKIDSFIVASGLREGLDLRGDLSYVQIFVKVPYADLGDKRTKRKKEIDASWYSKITVLQFVQMLGRSVRSSDDRAITYLFDSGFEKFLLYNWKTLPSYVRDAVKKEVLEI